MPAWATQYHPRNGKISSPLQATCPTCGARRHRNTKRVDPKLTINCLYTTAAELLTDQQQATMRFQTANSDALLRPDVSLLLPFLTATNPRLLLLSTALLPLKWVSGCDCFTALCARKRRSRFQTLAILITLLLTHLYSVHVPFQLALLVALITPESLDTKLLKIAFMLLGQTPLLGAPIGIFVFFGYLRICGYSLRLSDSYELLLSNDVWLITKDARLAKRVNHHGEFHAEVEDSGKSRLVGNGRLVGAGSDVTELPMERLDGLNRTVLEQAHEKGRVSIREGVFVFGK